MAELPRQNRWYDDPLFWGVSPLVKHPFFVIGFGILWLAVWVLLAALGIIKD